MLSEYKSLTITQSNQSWRMFLSLCQYIVMSKKIDVEKSGDPSELWALYALEFLLLL